LTNEASSTSLLQLISGAAKFINSTHIHNEDALVSAFVSTVSFSGSTISSINLVGSALEIISSTLEFTEMNVSNITTSNESTFIEVSLESSVSINHTLYSNANSKMFNLLSSEGMISNLTMRKVAGVSYLFEMYDCHNVQITNFNNEDSHSTGESLVLIRKSQNLTLNDLDFSSLNQTLVILRNSHVREIKNVTISLSVSPLIVENSRIEALSESTFAHNGNSNVLRGGALYLLNSDLNISNSSFENNTAESGGAVYFDCSSASL
jgi:predicted outer membrane repeat protein